MRTQPLRVVAAAAVCAIGAPGLAGGEGVIDAGAGFRSEGSGNRLDFKNATDCNRGFYITAQGDFMIRNTARNCTVGYQQTGTNVYGTIISSNYSPITTTSPWVNFEIF